MKDWVTHHVKWTLAALVAAIGIFGGLIHVNVNVEVNPKFGWVCQKAAGEAYDKAAPGLAKFAIRGDQDGDPARRAVLWQMPRLLLGSHIPTMTQPIGCCVGASGAQAFQYLCAQTGQYRPVFVPYTYACGRNARDIPHSQYYGNNPDGSSGVEQAQAAQRYGFLPADLPGLPAWDWRSATAWAVHMPAKEYTEIGKQHVVRTIARVTTTDDARRVIQNYYVLTIASDWGGVDRGERAGPNRYVVPIVNGMRLNSHQSSWSHQMLIIGFQVVNGRQYWYVLNNWGPDMHGPPIGDEPPGGFWIGEQDLQYILSRGDSWAYSDAVGFPARGLDFSIVDRGRQPLRHKVAASKDLAL